VKGEEFAHFSEWETVLRNIQGTASRETPDKLFKLFEELLFFVAFRVAVASAFVSFTWSKQTPDTAAYYITRHFSASEAFTAILLKADPHGCLISARLQKPHHPNR
jgi:hypothetical protein